MKKVLLAAMVLLAGVSFTSCSSSDDDDVKQEQKFDASKAMSGKWKLSKVQDFPLPINNYHIREGNTISFLDGGIVRTEGDFSVVINGDAVRPMTMPFGGYNTWRADNSYNSDGTVETGSALVYFNNNSEAYVAYFMSATEVYLVKFATTTQGIAYVLTK